MKNIISYANLKLKVSNITKNFKFQDNEIEVFQYLPMSDKYDLVMITLQKSAEEMIYNPIKLDMYFHLHLVYMYSNLNFTQKQKEDEEKIYDCLKSNGLLDLILQHIPETEYQELLHFIEELIEVKYKHSLSAAGMVEKIIGDLPRQAEAMREILKDYDSDKISNILTLAEKLQ